MKRSERSLHTAHEFGRTKTARRAAAALMGMVASAAVMVMGALPAFAAEGGLTVGMTPPTGDNLLMTAGVIVGVALVAAVVGIVVARRRRNHDDDGDGDDGGDGGSPAAPAAPAASRKIVVPEVPAPQEISEEATDEFAPVVVLEPEPKAAPAPKVAPAPAPAPAPEAGAAAPAPKHGKHGRG